MHSVCIYWKKSSSQLSSLSLILLLVTIFPNSSDILAPGSNRQRVSSPVLHSSTKQRCWNNVHSTSILENWALLIFSVNFVLAKTINTIWFLGLGWAYTERAFCYKTVCLEPLRLVGWEMRNCQSATDVNNIISGHDAYINGI